MKRKFELVEVKQPQEEYVTPWGKVWTRGADVLTTWRRYGFVPPSEYRNDFLFKINREGQ